MCERHIFHVVAYLLCDCSTITLAPGAKRHGNDTRRGPGPELWRGSGPPPPGHTTVISFAVAALALGLGAARIEGVQLVTDGSRLLIQVHVSGSPTGISVQREGDTARVWLKDAALGGPFSGGDRFEWVPVSEVSSAPSGSPSLHALGIQKYLGGVSLYFHAPPSMEIEVQRSPGVVTIVLREPPPRTVSVAAASPVPPPAPVKETERQSTQTLLAEAGGHEGRTEAPALAERATETAATPEPVAETAAELLRKLFPAAPLEAAPRDTAPPGPPIAAPDGDGPDTRVASADDLYRKLFPTAPPEPQDTPPVTPEARAGPPGPRMLRVGFFTLRPSLRTSYVRGQTIFESPQPVNAGYFEVDPSLHLETTFGEGHLMLGYEPGIRAFSSYDLLEETTHRLSARLDLPAGTRFKLAATDDFVNGVLEAEEVDPGSEYFFGLSRFRRNTAGVSASVEMAPRLGIEVGGTLNAVRFDRPVGFFPYDSRSAFLGLGFELTQTLKAAVDYAYDRVPPPADRPVVEATAHSVRVRLSGEITPLLTGHLSLGYRSQISPQAPESGRHFRGLVASGSVSKALGETSWLTLAVSRATPVSNFESNAFYISTHVGASLVVPLPLALSLDSGVDHRWNDYRTDASELGVPRQDRILGWRAGVRRSLKGMTSVAVAYRRERRHSNLDRFDNTTDGLMVQLDINVPTGVGRR